MVKIDVKDREITFTFYFRIILNIDLVEIVADAVYEKSKCRRILQLVIANMKLICMSCSNFCISTHLCYL